MAPPRSVRLRRFSSDTRLGARVARGLRTLPIAVPLGAGLLLAGVIDALFPDARATTPLALAALPAPEVAAVDVMTGVPPKAETMTTTMPSAPEPRAATTVIAPRASADPEDTARTTRDPQLERRIEKMLQDGKTPYAAVVVMEAHTGKVLAMAEHSTRGPSDGLALLPLAPAASVFKIVTASALLEAGVSPASRACFRGGKTRMTEKLLAEDPRRDRCITFGDVVPQSANVAIARLATRHLTPDGLRAHAARWGFGARVADIAGLVPSTAVIPDGTFAFAEAAAGFGDVKISALHGAVIASIVANDGVLVAPRVTLGGEPPRPSRVVSTTHARALRRMMTETVTEGTARRAFSQRPRLPISAAGKTGSLTDYATGLDTSWFVGFAPADAPELVVSAVVVNTAKWHIKAPWLARESLRAALQDHGPARPADRVALRR